MVKAMFGNHFLGFIILILMHLSLMYNAFQELSILSNELQSRTISLPKAKQLIKRTIRIIESFKHEPGEQTQLKLLNVKSKLLFNNIPFIRTKKLFQ